MKNHIRRATLALAAAGCLMFAQDKPADNTGKNKRDQDSATQTADKQTNAKGDRDLLQAIRKSVVADNSLSTYAHNVKIIVKNGVVTLRGPVKTEAERDKIVELAKQAGGKEIDNKIEIAPSK